MANMSYCRFHNTADALVDCLGAMEDAIEEGQNLEQFLENLSSDERRAFHKLIDLCDKIQGASEELEHDEAFEEEE